MTTPAVMPIDSRPARAVSTMAAVASTTTAPPSAHARPGDAARKRRAMTSDPTGLDPGAGCASPTQPTVRPDRSGNVTAEHQLRGCARHHQPGMARPSSRHGVSPASHQGAAIAPDIGPSASQTVSSEAPSPALHLVAGLAESTSRKSPTKTNARKQAISERCGRAGALWQPVADDCSRRSTRQSADPHPVTIQIAKFELAPIRRFAVGPAELGHDLRRRSRTDGPGCRAGHRRGARTGTTVPGRARSTQTRGSRARRDAPTAR